jgi:hypothetical protein
MVKTVREINDSISEDSTVSSSSGYQHSPYSKKQDNFVNAHTVNNYQSPRNESLGTKNQKSDEKGKMPFMRKTNATEEA